VIEFIFSTTIVAAHVLKKVSWKYFRQQLYANLHQQNKNDSAVLLGYMENANLLDCLKNSRHNF